MSISEALQSIDLTAFRDSLSQRGPRSAAAERVASSWDRAMRRHGFAQISGTGVDEDVVDELQQCARAFFAQERKEKMAHCRGDGYGNGGYVPVGVEAVAKSKGAVAAPSDLVETFVFKELDGSDACPDFPKGMREAVRAYSTQVTELLVTIMSLTAVALGLDDCFFEAYFRRPRNNLRLASYPIVKPEDMLPGQIAYGAHTDYTGFTILRQDETVPGGLQMQVDGAWLHVPPLPRTFVVNAGDLIHMWTNGVYRSALHRVCLSAQPSPRLSIVFFTGPSKDAVIHPIEQCCTPDNPLRFGAVSAEEWLETKLRLSNA